ncbi:MAG: hypothetical protein L0Z50_39260 [Verrucomicrobiales bacterium]|nr:hypothetical protein [Verrucomicrobiales bacterium]
MSTATKAKKANRLPRRPERKIGPFHNGLGIAIWLNEVETAQGTRWFRSITLAPRRYLDPKTGDWKDAASYRPVDLATLELAIAAARQFIASTPLPGQPVEGEEYEELHHESNGDGQVPM